MFSCASCNIQGCGKGDLSKVPKNCPCLDNEEMEDIKKLYNDEENMKIAHGAALTESGGYCQKTRVEEIIDFARRCGYKNIGIGFCIGLSREAAIFRRVLEHNGFQVNSISCKNGSIPKEFINISEEEKVYPNTYEPMCNPIGQAIFLNKANTDLNVLIGLCVGHDSLFIKHCKAPVTVLVAKDRVLCHNPVGALYQAEAYYKKKLFP